jgi:heme-degrading monooxygenase HmoA
VNSVKVTEGLATKVAKEFGHEDHEVSRHEGHEDHEGSRHEGREVFGHEGHEDHDGVQMLVQQPSSVSGGIRNAS